MEASRVTVSSMEVSVSESEEIITPTLPRLRLLNSPPTSLVDVGIFHTFYQDSTRGTQTAAVRILNAFPYANLDELLLSRLASIISVRILLPWVTHWVDDLLV